MSDSSAESASVGIVASIDSSLAISTDETELSILIPPTSGGFLGVKRGYLREVMGVDFYIGCGCGLGCWWCIM